MCLFLYNLTFAESLDTSSWGIGNQHFSEIKPALTDKQRASVIKKIANKSQLFYSKLLEKVEEVIEKTKNDDLKAKLEEVRVIIINIINTKIN